MQKRDMEGRGFRSRVGFSVEGLVPRKRVEKETMQPGLCLAVDARHSLHKMQHFVLQ